MMLVWKDVRSFNRHLESMRTFRRRHGTGIRRLSSLLKDMPATLVMSPGRNTGGAFRPASPRGMAVSFPLWQVRLPGSARN